MQRILVFSAALLLATFTLHAQTIRYVNPVASGTQDGSSWANASADLQLMINNSSSGNEVWVAAGVYKPVRPADNPGTTDAGNRDNAFVLKSGVKLYGGFAGTETSLSQRPPSFGGVGGGSTLSGDLDNSGTLSGGDAYHVVISAGAVSTAILDGFTVTGGNANGSFSITVNGQNIVRNQGGGIHNQSSSPTLANCVFFGNSADYQGGGMYNTTSSPGITNCTFSGSSASYGGGMYNTSSSPSLANCLFSGNSSSSGGGGMSNEFASSPSLANCTFSGNSSSSGGGMLNISSSPSLANCIIWNNRADGVTTSAAASIFNSFSTPSISYSILANIVPSGTNMNADPLFVTDVDPATAPVTAGNLRLQAGSPAINAGNNAAIPSGITTDLDGNLRIINGTVDMGAYEYQENPVPVITCPANVSVNVDAGTCGAIVNYPPATATGTAPVITYSQNSGTLFPPGTTTVTAIATNASGADTCTFDVTVTDHEAPVIICPANISANNAAGQCSAVVTYSAPSGSDNCPGATTTQTAGLASGASFPVGVTTNIFKVTDAVGNTSTCSFTVTVTDNEAPVAASATSANAYYYSTYTGIALEDLSTGATQVFGSGLDDDQSALINLPFAFKYKGAARTHFSISVNGFFIFNDGTTGVNPYNNTTSNAGFNNIISANWDDMHTCTNGSVTYKVLGNSPGRKLVIQWQVGDFQLRTSPFAKTFQAWLYEGTNDIQYVYGNGTNSLNAGGTIGLRGSTATDFNLVTSTTHTNSTTTINDANITWPGAGRSYIFTSSTGCPANITANVSAGQCGTNVNWTEPLITDNCSIASTTSNHNPGDFFPVGTTAVTYTTTDVNGNTGTCSFNVTVVDNEAPLITCPSNISVNNSPGTCGAVVNYTAPAGTDICSGATTEQTAGLASGAIFPVGITTNTFKATDAVGNTSTCSFTVTVTDIEAPLINCGANIVTSGCGNISVPSPVVTENCTYTSNALQFDGDDYFEGTNTQLPQGASPFTVEAWIYPTSAQNGTIFDWGVIDFPPGMRASLLYINQRIYFSGFFADLQGNTACPPGAWYHFAATYDGTTVRVYVNGNLDASFNIALNVTGFGFRAGRATNPGGQEPFIGKMDELRVWNVMKTQVQLNGSKNNPVPPQSALVAYYRFDQGTAGGDNTAISQVIDNSGNGGNGTLVNFSKTGTASNFVTGTDALHAYTLSNSYNNSANASGDYPPGITNLVWTVTDISGNTATCTQSVTVNFFSGTAYVDSTATGSNDGSNWTNAFSSFADAVAFAHCNTNIDTILVARGTYYPEYIAGNGSGNRDKAFTFTRNGLTALGGYPSGGGTRDLLNNPTILSADIGVANDSTDNTYHVVITAGVNNTMVLDGFTLTKGNANTGSDNIVAGETISRSRGGVIINSASSPTIINCIISRGSADYGGGMYNRHSSSPAITNTNFISNAGSTFGGAMMDEETSLPVLNGCIFSENLCGYGGGAICNFSGSSPSFANCVFSGNHANTFGGAVVNALGAASSPGFTNCIFSGNSSGAYGGAMFSQDNAIPKMINCRFLGNAAVSYGGAIYSNTSSAIIRSCSFSGNAAGNIGGVMFNHVSSPIITNCSFSGNSSVNQGGGIYSQTNSVPVVTNCIFWNNLSSGTIDGVSASMDNNGITPVVNYSILAGVPATGTNINTDPLFITPVDPITAPTTAGNLRLQACSPAIDAGNNGSVPLDITTDLDGNDRIWNSGTVDMGAYEYQGSSIVVPGITCPANVSVNNDAGNCGAIVNYAAATTTGTSPVITYSQNSGTSFPAGTTTVTVIATNSCGAATCSFDVTVVDNEPPIITCPANVAVNTDNGTCVATNVVLSTPITNDNCGVQTISNNAPTIYPIGNTNVTWTVSDIHGNTATCVQVVTVTNTNVVAVNISTPATTICNGNVVTFTATPTHGGTNPIYQWKVNNVNKGTNSTDFTPATLANGNVVTCVMTSNIACPAGALTATSNPIQMSLIGAPAKPGAITQVSGNLKLCPGDTASFEISPAFNATDYTWTAPSGATIISGQNTTGVTLAFNTGFAANGSLSVTASNSCGYSQIQTRTITRDKAPVLNAITGSASVPCMATGVSYNLNAIADAGFNWYFNSTTASVASGNGTNSILADFDGFTSATLYVSATTGCGTSALKTMAIKYTPENTGAISGPNTVCSLQTNVAYSIIPLPNVLSYTWTAPAGATISDGVSTQSGTLITGSPSVTINFGTKSGAVKVKSNNCSTGAVSQLTVTTASCIRSFAEEQNQENSFISLFPNPAKETINVTFKSDRETNYIINVFDALGKEVLEQTGNAQEGINQTVLNVSNLASGVYQLMIIGDASGDNGTPMNYKVRFVVE